MAHRTRVSSGSPYERRFGFCRAVREGDRVWVAGTAPIWPSGHVDPDVGTQARRVVAIIERALAQAGASLDDVVRTRTYLVSAADGDTVGRVHGEAFRRARPVNTTVVVAGFLDERWKLEVEVEAVIRAPGL